MEFLEDGWKSWRLKKKLEKLIFKYWKRPWKCLSKFFTVPLESVFGMVWSSLSVQRRDTSGIPSVSVVFPKFNQKHQGFRFFAHQHPLLYNTPKPKRNNLKRRFSHTFGGARKKHRNRDAFQPPFWFDSPGARFLFVKGVSSCFVFKEFGVKKIHCQKKLSCNSEL